MNLKDYYNKLWQEAAPRLREGEVELDFLLDSEFDKRFGISLIARPGNIVRQNVCEFLGNLQAIEPEQYFYPESDFHITIMSVISCCQGFMLEDVKVEDYINLITECIQNCKSFVVEFRGIAASPAGVILQGFPENNQLSELRNQIRSNFKSSGLRQSIDTRYAIQTAHSTVVRFRKPMHTPADFVQQLEKYRGYYFGNTSIGELELVFNDWYQRQEKVKLLHTFKLY